MVILHPNVVIIILNVGILYEKSSFLVYCGNLTKNVGTLSQNVVKLPQMW